MNTKKHTIDRRSFLKASALTGGGLIIGFNFFTACKPKVKPPVDISKLNFNDFNGFIKIADNGMVTIFAPNPEIGQGVKTSMPMIIAEELDVSWDNVHVVQGGLDTDVFERQVAGGSQSIRHGWNPLRETGATAKQMLVNAAAARWGIDAGECTVENGIITNKNGDKLGYGEVAVEAAALEVPKDVKLKDPKDYKIIGQDIPNVDVDEIITGKPLFGLDYKREGMLYVSVLRPPAFGQKLVSFDDKIARSKEGVVDIVSFGNKIAVLANSTWEAMRAKKALTAVWEKDTALESSEDHDKLLLDLLDSDNLKTLRSDGNVKKAFASADKILERTYESPVLPHNCLEPMNFFASVTDEKIELAGPIQTPKGTAERIAKKLGRDFKDITLEMTRMGGGFGRRLYGDFALEAAEISNIVRKPLLVIFSREDDMADGIYRP
ncbi:MAG: xanthine dehydrogenase family protein molybdopterin-binding subunit, partial [Flavobacteriaceae bacterium]|nr:xanthine dehydrogenase family protein molybdopterin-binding subunit [Flavobacteriaceae bacterium]